MYYTVLMFMQSFSIRKTWLHIHKILYICMNSEVFYEEDNKHIFQMRWRHIYMVMHCASYRGTRHQICSRPPALTPLSPSLPPQRPLHKSRAPLPPSASAHAQGRLCILHCHDYLWLSCKRSHLVETGGIAVVLYSQWGDTDLRQKDQNCSWDSIKPKNIFSPGLVDLHNSLTASTGTWPTLSAPTITTTSNKPAGGSEAERIMSKWDNHNHQSFFIITSESWSQTNIKDWQ